MTEWEELDGPDDHEVSVIADRVISAFRRRRTRRSALLGVAVLGIAAAVVVPSLTGTGGGGGTVTADITHHPSPASPVALTPDVQGEIYAAAIGGEAGPRQRHPRILVRNQVCEAVPQSAAAQCGDRPIPVAVQQVVRALLGDGVEFAAHAPNPNGVRERTVVVFGALHIRGTRATLGMELLCGPLCGEGRTLMLTRVDGRWRVTGRTGPEWIS